MNRTKTFGILFLLVLLLLTGCSKDSLMERGAGMLDNIFAGDAVADIPSAPAEPDPEPEPASSVDPGTEPTIPVSAEPDMVDPDKPVVSDYPGLTTPAEPVQSTPVQSAPEPSKSTATPAASTTSTTPAATTTTAATASSPEITPSHTDVTFFGPGESIRYQPKGVTGVYACTYSTGNDKIASVDEKTGKVTAVGPGTTKVKMHVESNGQYDFECIVRCSWTDDKDKETDKKPAASSGSSPNNTSEPTLPPTPAAPSTSSSSPEGSDGTISASHSDATLFNPKEAFRLLPVGAGDDYSATYTSSDESIATVNSKGLVTAVSPGSTTVTMAVDCGGNEYTFKCIVRCSW